MWLVWQINVNCFRKLVGIDPLFAMRSRLIAPSYAHDWATRIENQAIVSAVPRNPQQDVLVRVLGVVGLEIGCCTQVGFSCGMTVVDTRTHSSRDCSLKFRGYIAKRDTNRSKSINDGIEDVGTQPSNTLNFPSLQWRTIGDSFGDSSLGVDEIWEHEVLTHSDVLGSIWTTPSTIIAIEKFHRN